MTTPRIRHALLGAVGLGLACATSVGATTPGENGRIAFSKEVHGHYQLFTIAPDGSDLQQLTRLPGDVVNSDWSPDGGRLVFEYDRPHEKGCGLMVVDSDGSDPVDLS